MKNLAIYFLTTFIVFTGCANVYKDIHLYEGPHLSKDKIGEIYLGRSRPSAGTPEYYYIEKVDSEDVGITNRLYLLPGRHAILLRSRRGELMNWKQLKGGIYGGSGWYLKSEVLLSLEIETGHKYKYILKEASDGNLLLSKVVPVIVDVTDQQDKRTVSQMTESGDALYRNIKYDGEDFYHLEKVFADLQKINIEEFNISTNTIELLTLEIPYEGLLLFSNFIKEKNWYKEGDIVRIAFSYDQRYKKIWPNWLRVNRAYGRYDIFVQTPEGGWYCWPNSGMDSQRYVNSID